MCQRASWTDFFQCADLPQIHTYGFFRTSSSQPPTISTKLQLTEINLTWWTHTKHRTYLITKNKQFWLITAALLERLALSCREISAHLAFQTNLLFSAFYFRKWVSISVKLHLYFRNFRTLAVLNRAMRGMWVGLVFSFSFSGVG